MARKRVVFLMSDTGGGHRAAADAIRAAMEIKYPDEYLFELVDVYRRYTPFPFTYMPEVYAPWVNWAAHSWEFGYEFANTRHRGRLVMAVAKQLWKNGMRRLIQEHPTDVMVSVHSLFNRPVMHAYNTTQKFRPPFVTVITDLVTTHAFWYEPDVDRCLAPTQAAYDRGLFFGLKPEQMRITGLPVHPQFMKKLVAKDEARRKLNWDSHHPAVLLVGGGEGMGPLYQIARAINSRKLDMQLIIIAGRNQALKQRLESSSWNQPTIIYPFVHNMPELMAAADILVTKAGPGTICEACIAGVPLILSSFVPGQEDGNVTHVVENNAGVYAPGGVNVAETISQWLDEGSEGLAARSASARALGRPNAVWEIAEEIHLQAQKPPVRTRYHAEHQPHLGHTPEDGWVI
ncbi:MAG TPA: glycosyltransferase [Aggregatilineaceae bacterium]|nr:glycosyltransferase [Aggregatilineaceae bacterium]